MSNLAKLNKDRIDSLSDGMSHGMKTLIKEIKRETLKPNGSVTLYFNWQTANRLMAHIIVDNRLERLVIPEAGHRLYANLKDGYQANGGGYSKPQHITERMIREVQKHITKLCTTLFPCDVSIVRYEVIL